MSDRFIFNTVYQLNRKISETDDFELFSCIHIKTKQAFTLWFLKRPVAEFELHVSSLQELKHVNLVKILSYGIQENTQFLVTEELGGHFVRYASYYQSLSPSQLITITRTMFDLEECLSAANISVFSFASQYIFRQAQGQYKFMPLQPQLLSLLANTQLSFITSPAVNYFVPKGVELNEESLADYRFYSLFFVWLEQAASADAIQEYFGSDTVSASMLSLNLKNEFLGLRDLVQLAYDENEFRSVLDSFLNFSLYTKTNLSDVLKDLVRPVVDSIIFDLPRGNSAAHLVVSDEVHLLRELRRELHDRQSVLGYTAHYFNATEFPAGKFAFLEALLRALATEGQAAPEAQEFFPREHKTFAVDYEKRYAEAALLRLGKLSRNEQNLVFIDHVAELDSESAEFIGTYFPVIAAVNIHLVFLSRGSAEAELRQGFSTVQFKNHYFKPLREVEIQKIAQAELKLDLLQANTVAKTIYARGAGKLGFTLLVFDWLRLAFKSSLNDVPHICKQIEAINNTDFIFEAKLEQVNRYVELLLFFAFLKKPISLELLEDAFANGNSLEALLSHLVSERILYLDEMQRFSLVDSTLRNHITHVFPADMVSNISRHFLTISQLKPYFDFELGIQVHRQQRKYDLAAEICVKEGNYLNQNLAEKQATERYREALDLAENFDAKLSETVRQQVLRSLHDYYKKEAQYRLAYDALEKRTPSSAEDKTLQEFQKIELKFLMDEFAEITLDESVHLAETSSAHQKLYFSYLRGTDYYFNRLFSQALEEFNSILSKQDVDLLLYEKTIQRKLEVLSELGDSLEEDAFTSHLVHRKSKVVSGECLYHLQKKRAIELFQSEKYEEARSLFLECEKLAGKLKLHEDIGDIVTFLAGIAAKLDVPSAALPIYRNALEKYEAIHAQRKMGKILGELSILYKDLGKISKAIEAEHRAYDIFQEIGARDELIYSLSNLGHIYLLIFDFDSAERHLKHAVQLSQSLNKVEAYCHSLLYLSMVESMRGHTSEAAKYLVDAINLITDSDTQNYIHYTYYRALCDYESGKFEEAKDGLLLIINSNLLKENKKYNFVFSFLLGASLVALREDEKGEQLLERSLAMALKQENVIYQLLIQLKLYDFYIDKNEEKLAFTEQAITRLVRKLSESIKDDVLRVNFLQSRQISRFKHAAVS